jgi:AraC-like DNA-binding protein
MDRIRAVSTLAFDYRKGAHTGIHHHPEAQIIYAEAGVMRVTTPEGVWIVPPQRAVWVPPNVEHDVEMRTAVRMRSVYLDPAMIRSSSEVARVIQATPLLRELIMAAAGIPLPYPAGGPEERLFSVLADQIILDAAVPLHLRFPHDPRLAPIVRALESDPSDDRNVEDWAASVAVSGRTLARLFRAETGLSFGAWRQRYRLLRALELLATGTPVTETALVLGYESTSAFIAMFRRHLGTTPARYFAPEPHVRQSPAAPVHAPSATG